MGKGGRGGHGGGHGGHGGGHGHGHGIGGHHGHHGIGVGIGAGRIGVGIGQPMGGNVAFRHGRRFRRGGGGFGGGAILLQPEYFPTGLLAVHTFGADGACGCPSCTETIVVAPSLHTLPQALVGLYSQQEWTDFIRRIDEVFAGTHWPALPCMFTHFCIPFSPICAMSACRSRRREKLTEVIMAENKLRLPQGLEWVQCQPSVFANTRFMVLRFNPEQRQAYEASNMGVRKVTQEPIATEFLPPPAPAIDPAMLAMMGAGAGAVGPGSPSAVEMQMVIAQQQLLIQQQQQPGGVPVAQLGSSTSSSPPGGVINVQPQPQFSSWPSSPSAPQQQTMMDSSAPLIYQQQTTIAVSSTTIGDGNTNAGGAPQFCESCGTRRDSGKFCAGCGKNLG